MKKNNRLGMRGCLGMAILLLCSLPIQEYCVAEDMDRKEKDAFRDVKTRLEVRGKFAAYQQFVQAYPKSILCDDALLEVLKAQLQQRDIDAARKTLEVMNHLYPAGIMQRHLSVGDIEEAVGLAWRTFVAMNPIRTVDWGQLLVASFLAKHNDLKEAKKMALDLLTRTKKLTLPNDINPDALSTEDIRGAVLQLCFNLAKQSGDDDLARMVKNRAFIEYNIKEKEEDIIEAADSMPLIEWKRIQMRIIERARLDARQNGAATNNYRPPGPPGSDMERGWKQGPTNMHKGSTNN